MPAGKAKNESPQILEPVINTGVPVLRFYLVVIIFGVLMGCFGYVAGKRQGDTNCQLENAEIGLKTQKEVYENDLAVEKEIPAGGATGSWADWMEKQIP